MTAFTDTLSLKHNDIHIWQISLPLSNYILEALSSSLSLDENIRLKNYYFKKDRHKFIARRGALRNILAQYVNTPASEIEFSYREHGKPELNKPKINKSEPSKPKLNKSKLSRTEPSKPELSKNPLNFNLSHSGNQIVIAVTNNQYIGIDIEQLNLNLAFLDIAKQFFSENEFLKLSNSNLNFEEQSLAFYRCWTRKEAYLKATGEGLSFPIHQLEVSFLPDEMPRIISVGEKPSREHSSIDKFTNEQSLIKPSPAEQSLVEISSSLTQNFNAVNSICANSTNQWKMLEFFPREDYIGALVSRIETPNITFFNWP